MAFGDWNALGISVTVNVIKIGGILLIDVRTPYLILKKHFTQKSFFTTIFLTNS
jgi:hypothetical protein